MASALPGSRTCRAYPRRHHRGEAQYSQGCGLLSSARRLPKSPASTATINQYFAVLTNVHSVGVMGDGRTYENVLALRGVTTSDFMTAEWTQIPYGGAPTAPSVRIVDEVPHINRIVYDITSKPPATVPMGVTPPQFRKEKTTMAVNFNQDSRMESETHQR